MFPAPTLGMITLTTLLILNILANELHELTMLLTLPHSIQFIACTAMQSIPLSNGHLCFKTSCSLPSLFRLDHPDTGSLGRGNFTASCLTFMKRKGHGFCIPSIFSWSSISKKDCTAIWAQTRLQTVSFVYRLPPICHELRQERTSKFIFYSSPVTSLKIFTLGGDGACFSLNTFFKHKKEKRVPFKTLGTYVRDALKLCYVLFNPTWVPQPWGPAVPG